MAAVLLLLAATGCNFLDNQEGHATDNGEHHIDDNLQPYEDGSGKVVFYRQADLPDAVNRWIEGVAFQMPLAQSKVFGNYLYILVTYGPKPTDGYGVKITDVRVDAAEVIVEVEFTEPDLDDNITHDATNPYDIVLIPAVELPVRYVARGVEQHVMALYGIYSLEPVVAYSDYIKLFGPAPGANVSSSLLIHGVGSTFEGMINYRLRTDDGTVLVESYTLAGMGDWYYFEEVLDLTELIPDGISSLPAILDLYTLNARDGSEENHISLDLVLGR